MWMNLLLVFIPISLLLEYVFHAPPLWVFASAVVSIIPLADWLRQATEQVAERAGQTIGGLLNVTFGNMAELIIAVFVLLAGNATVVKAQITGSIIGNGLLGLGLAILIGSLGRPQQQFNRQYAGQLNSMLFLTMIALLIPALFDYTERLPDFAANSTLARGNLDESLSLAVAVVLILVYGLNLVYTLVTHKDIFALAEETEGADGMNAEQHHVALWPVWKSAAVMVAATALIALESEMLSGALEATAETLRLSPFFLGIVVLAVVGNFAEYIAGSYFARQGKIGLAMNIAVGATIQVALFTAPVLVIISYLIGKPMNLVFSSPLELVAIAAVAITVSSVTRDGETTWFEGALLITVYVLLGLAFFFVTPRSETRSEIKAARPGATLTLTPAPQSSFSAPQWKSA